MNIEIGSSNGHMFIISICAHFRDQIIDNEESEFRWVKLS